MDNQNNNSNVNHLRNLDPKFSENLYKLFNEMVERGASNAEYIEAMTRYGGYLSYQQRLELNKKYAKMDGDRQIKNHEETLKAQQKYYDQNIKPRIDPTLPVNSSYNLMIAKKASEEDAALQKLVAAYEIAKVEAAKNQTYKVSESADARNNFLNVRHKNVIVEYRDGTISYINEATERERMKLYKEKLEQNHKNDSFKSVENDPEYS